MSIKLSILKSGEQIIADVKEYIDENQQVVSLLFTNPYIVKFLTPELLVENAIENREDTANHKVSFSPWIIMSEDKSMTIPLDWVVTIVEPIEWVKKSYEEKMNQSIEGLIKSNKSESNQNFSEFKNMEVITE